MEIKRGFVSQINRSRGTFKVLLKMTNDPDSTLSLTNDQIRKDYLSDLDKLDIGMEVLVISRLDLNGNLEPIEWFFTAKERMHMVINSARRVYLDASGDPIDGEIVITKDGKQKRIYDPHGDGKIQPCFASFYLGPSGGSISAGTLDYPISTKNLRETGEYRDARFWIFKDLEPKANNGYDVVIPVRVWKEIGE